MKSLIPDWLPKLFVKAEGSVREATTKKFSDFNKITDTEGMEVVGIKGGANVRADFPVVGEAGEVTTSMVGLEPDDALRNTRGQFMPTKELPELNNQKDANRFLASELQRLEQEIDGIEAGGGDVDLSDYATIEYVDETELNVLNAAINVAKDGDAALQAQIDELEAPDLTGYATETYVDDSIAAIEFPEGVDLSGYAKEEWVTEQIDAIDFPVTDLTGYATEDYVDDAIDAIPETDLTGYATEEYVDNNLDAVAGQIPSLDGYATEDYVDDAIGGIVHPTYDDSGIKSDLSAETAARVAGDNTLQAEITELALALDTLLVQKTHGQWKYIGFMGDNIPRNPGEFALGSDDLSSTNNVIQVNNTDLNGMTIGLGDVGIGDYVEIVDVGDPKNYVLFVVSTEPNGTGISDIGVTLKEKGNNFLINATCEMRFFELNDQSIDLSELDDRYARKDHTHPEFTELQGGIDEINDYLQSLEPPDFGAEPGEGEFDYRRAVGWFYCLEEMRTTASSTNFYLYNDGTGDLSTATHFDINRGLFLIDGTTNTYTEWDEKLEQGEWLNFFLPGGNAYSGNDLSIDIQVGRYDEFIPGSNGFDAFRFEVMAIRATPAVATLDASGKINRTYTAVQMDYGIGPATFVTPDQLNASIDGVIEVSQSGDAELQNQIDFMAQEINHLIPLKTQASWKVTPSYSSPGGMKFNNTARYGPWDDDIDSLFFNRIDHSGVDHSEMLENFQIGDKFEVFISKNNYCLFEVTRAPYSYDKYIRVYAKPVKYEGEGYAMYDLIEIEFFDSSEGLKNSIKEEMAGHYLYSQATIADQINVNNIHEHPGKFLCIDAAGLVIDAQYGNIKTVHFAPVDANGNRPPCEKTSSTKIKKKCWAVNTRTIKDNVVVPSFQYTSKTYEKNFTVGQTYNQAAQNIPTIKFHPDDYVTYEFEVMDSKNQWWKWPI